MFYIGFSARSGSKCSPCDPPTARPFRHECVECFTTKGNIGEVQILVISTRIAATAVILQADYYDVIFLDIPNNAQTLLQAGARVLRIGQGFLCNFFILTVDDTYDQATQANQALKMRPIITGQAGIDDPTSLSSLELLAENITLRGNVYMAR